MNIPKYHKPYEKKYHLDLYQSTKQEAIERIEEMFQAAFDAGCADPRLSVHDESYYGESHYFFLVEGVVPMTEKEIEKAKAKEGAAKAAKRAEAKAKRQKEKEEFARLAKKFKVEIPELN